MSWPKPRPKMTARRPPSHNPPAENAQNEGWAIALVGGWGPLRPPDSEWGETLRAASVCPRDVPGTAAPKNDRPKAPVPQPLTQKMPKMRGGYSLGGGLRPTSTAALGMGRDFVSGLRVPAGCSRHSRAKKRAPEVHRPTAPQRKNAQNEGWAIALVGGWGQLCPPDSEWGETLRKASVYQK